MVSGRNLRIWCGCAGWGWGVCLGHKTFNHENFFSKVHVEQVNTFRKGWVSFVDKTCVTPHPTPNHGFRHGLGASATSTKPLLWASAGHVCQMDIRRWLGDWWLRDTGSGSSASETHHLTGKSPGECWAHGRPLCPGEPGGANRRSKFIFGKKPRRQEQRVGLRRGQRQ